MTIKELKEAIANLPDEMEVVLQKKGSEFSPLADVDSDAVYVPKTTWSGDVYSMDWTADDVRMTDEEWEDIKLKPRALILQPVN